MKSTHYPLHIIQDEYLLKYPRTFGLSYNLLLSRINALATFLGVGKSTAYFFDPDLDPNTRTVFCKTVGDDGWEPFYGVPQFVHYKIMTPNGPSYMREWIDLLRAIAGITPFPWAYTPSIDDYWAVSNGKANSEIQNRVGVSAKPILEMLFAIGRLEYHSGETKNIRIKSEVQSADRTNESVWEETKDWEGRSADPIVDYEEMKDLWGDPDNFTTTLNTEIGVKRVCSYDYGTESNLVAGSPFSVKELTDPLSSCVERLDEDYGLYIDYFTGTFEDMGTLSFVSDKTQLISQTVEAVCEYVDKLGSDTVSPKYDWVELENISHVHTQLIERVITPDENNLNIVYGASQEYSEVSTGTYNATLKTGLLNSADNRMDCYVTNSEGERKLVVSNGRYVVLVVPYFEHIGSTDGQSISTTHNSDSENYRNFYPTDLVKTSGEFRSSDTEPTTFADFYSGDSNTNGRYVWVKPNLPLEDLWALSNSQTVVPSEGIIQEKCDGLEDLVKSIEGHITEKEALMNAGPFPAYFDLNAILDSTGDAVQEHRDSIQEMYVDGFDYYPSEVFGEAHASVRFIGEYIYGETLLGDCPAIHELRKSSAIHIWWDQFVEPTGYPESLNPSS